MIALNYTYGKNCPPSNRQKILLLPIYLAGTISLYLSHLSILNASIYINSRSESQRPYKRRRYRLLPPPVITILRSILPSLSLSLPHSPSPYHTTQLAKINARQATAAYVPTYLRKRPVTSVVVYLLSIRLRYAGIYNSNFARSIDRSLPPSLSLFLSRSCIQLSES